jgi:trigger factor
MVTSDLLSENTYKFLRDKAQIELVPEGSLQEAQEEQQDSETQIETVEVEVVADSE